MEKKLNNDIENHEKYKKVYETALDWLKNTKTAIQCLISSANKKSDIIDKMDQLHNFENCLLEGN